MNHCHRAALLLAVLGLPVASFAQVYPTKVVRVLVGFPAGGANDVAARIVMQKTSEMLGQQFIIENRAGASGTAAADFVAKSAPDGYTILAHSVTLLISAHLYKKLPYDTLNDFAGIAAIANQVFVLDVPASLPVKSVKEFIALAKKRPGELTYATAGDGSGGHLQMELFSRMAGIKLTHVPYKGGALQALSVATGETQAAFNVITDILPYVKTNRVRLLGVGTSKRQKDFPDLPAIGESVPGFDYSGWTGGVFAPAGTPKSIIDKLNVTINKVVEDPVVSARLAAQALSPLNLTPDEFAQRFKSDYAKLGKLIREIGITLD